MVLTLLFSIADVTVGVVGCVDRVVPTLDSGMFPVGSSPLDLFRLAIGQPDELPVKRIKNFIAENANI